MLSPRELVRVGARGEGRGRGGRAWRREVAGRRVLGCSRLGRLRTRPAGEEREADWPGRRAAPGGCARLAALNSTRVRAGTIIVVALQRRRQHRLSIQAVYVS